LSSGGFLDAKPGTKAMVSYYLTKRIELRIISALCHLKFDKRKLGENKETKPIGFIGRLAVGFLGIWRNPNPEVHAISRKLSGF
jgi:hypothetical protein